MKKGVERRFSCDLHFGFRGDSLSSLGIGGRHEAKGAASDGTSGHVPLAFEADPPHEPCEGGSGRPDRLGIPVGEAGEVIETVPANRLYRRGRRLQTPTHPNSPLTKSKRERPSTIHCAYIGDLRLYIVPASRGMDFINGKIKWIGILWAYFQLAPGTNLSSRSAQIAA